MMKRGTLILSAAILCLGLFIFASQDKPLRLSTIDATKVRKIRVEKPGKPPIVFSKTDGVWRDADQQKINDLLALLQAAPAKKLEGNDPSRYGLDHPAAIIDFDGNQFSLGMFNPLSGEQYVSTGNGIYLVPPRYTVFLSRNF